MKLSELKPLKRNPRTITPAAMKRLEESISRDPEYMVVRPIICNQSGVILGGNQRYQACKNLGMKEIPDNWIKTVEWTEEKAKRFSVVDNAPEGMAGDWDMEVLRLDWSTDELEGLGFSIEEEIPDTETGRLSDYQFNDIYFEPEEKPGLKLSECFNLEKFHKKVDAIEKSGLNKKIKSDLMLLAYRFIKIDFQSVAEYYAFNASEEEKAIIEELRAVLVDGTANGFIQDDIDDIYEGLEELSAEVEID